MVRARRQRPADVALTFECELGYTFLIPAVWGQGFATEAACCVRDYAPRRFAVAVYRSRPYFHRIPARGVSPSGVARGLMAKWK